MHNSNIVIIVFNTLPEDHVQDLDKPLHYGFVKYQNAIAPTPYTLVSHACVLTVPYP
jgi:hypothetical protein